jgi:cytochrome c biogenesis protein CcmG, thiol:disulfide interchange protein DsbE
VRPSKRAMTRALLSAAVVAALTAALVVPAQALSRGSRAPEIGLQDTRGRMVRLSQLRGKVVLVDFWASWCRPCAEEMPVLERLHDEYRSDGLVVVGVNIDNEERNMRRFLQRTPVSFRIVHDSGHRVADRYDPPRMPSSYLIDRRGVVRYVHAGFRASDARQLEQHVRELLGR